MLWAFTALAIVSVAQTSFAAVSVEFNRGFIGAVGNNTQKANNIQLLSSLTITKAVFSQNLVAGQTQFQVQGNDIPGTLTLYFTGVGSSASPVSINGAIVWLDKSGSTIDSFGFISNPNVLVTIGGTTIDGDANNNGGSSKGEAGDSNIGLTSRLSAKTYTAGQDVSGSADAGQTVADALNAYLAAPESQPATFSLNKAATSSVSTGGTITYTLKLGNVGGVSSGTTATVSDQLPADVIATAATPGNGVSAVSCTNLNAVSGGALLTCTVTLSAIPAGQSATNANAPTFTLTATAPASAGSITNYASVDATGGSSPPSPGAGCTTSNCASAATTVRSPASFTLSKSATSSVVTSGAITYTLTITNTGQTTSGTSATVAEQLPTNVTSNSVTVGTRVASVTGCTGTGLLTCTVTLSSGLAQNATASFTINATAPATSGAITNYASLDSTGGNAPPTPGTSCNTADCASAGTTVNDPANVTLDKTGPANASTGAAIEYTIALGNSGGTASSTSLTVKDRLPSGSSYSSVTSVRGITGTPSCSVSGGILSCAVTLSTAIPAGQATSHGSAPTFKITLTAPSTAGSITNYANVGATGGTPSDPPSSGACPDTSCDSAATTVNASENVTLSKTGPATALTSGSIEYTIALGNSGGVNSSTSLTVKDRLPTGSSYSSVTSVQGITGTPSCSVGGGILSCTVTLSAAIPAGQATSDVAAPTFKITLTAPSAAGSITNYANVGATGGTPSDPPSGGACPDASCGSASTTVGSPASFTLSKAATATVLTSGTISYTLTITNTGQTTSGTSVTIKEQLPTNVTANSVTVGGGVTSVTGCTGTGLLTCTVTLSSGLAQNATASFTINATAPATSGAITNYASLDSTGGNAPPTPGASCNTADCASAATTVAAPASLAISKTLAAVNGGTVPSPFYVKSGDVLRYDIVATNSGGQSGTTTLTETVPSNTSYTGNAGAEGWTDGGSVYTQDVTVTASGSVTKSFTVTVGTLIDGVTAITNAVTTSAGSCASCSVTINTVPRLSISKSVPTSLPAGGSAEYTLTIVNNGGSATSGVVTVVDALPSGLSFLSQTAGASGLGCSSSGQSINCTGSPNLASGSSLTVSYRVNVATGATGALINSALFTALGGDPRTPANDAINPTAGSSTQGSDKLSAKSAQGVPSLKAVKTAATAQGVGLGKAIDYTITVKNTGSVTVASVTLTDAFTDANGGALTLDSGPTFVTGTNGATAASLAPGETLTYTARYTIGQAAINAGGVKNTVTASGKDPANNTVSDKSDNGNDSDGNTGDDDTVTGLPNLTITKTSLGSPAQPLRAGSASSYDIQVSNKGLGGAAGATILETIGKGLQLNSIAGAGWACTYANGEPLTLPAKGPLTVKCVTQNSIAAQGGNAAPIAVSVTPLPGFLGLKLTTDASTDQSGGANPPPTGASCSPIAACASNSGEVTPEAIPTVGIGFASSRIPVGGQTRVTVTIVNKTGGDFSSLAQTQILPTGLIFLTDPKALTNCNGTVSVVNGVLTLTGGALAAGGSCTFSALVTSNAASGSRFTATAPVAAIKNAQSKTNDTAASADLIVDGAFAVRKSFQSSQGALGVPVKLTVAIDNTGSQTLSDVSFIDEMPVAPGKMVVADDPKVVNTCGGVITAVPKTNRLALAGGVVPAGGCAVSAMVVADDVGDYLNVIPDGGSTGNPNGLRGKLPDGSPLGAAAGSSIRVNIDRPSSVSGIFTKRVGFGQQIPQVGVTVVLKDADGNVVATTTTKADGSYLFTNLPPTLLGDSTTKYRVEFVTPKISENNPGLVKGAPSADDKSINGTPVGSGIAGVTLLPGGETPKQNGFVIDPSGVVYDSITRQPVPGTRVTLIGPTGVAVPDSQLDTVAGTRNGAAVGADGLYVLLLNETAPSGVYRLQVDVPAGYTAASSSATSELIPPQPGPYLPKLGGGVEFIQPQIAAPTEAEGTQYYMSVRLIITNDPATSSNGIAQNHMPIDPLNLRGTGALQVTKVGSAVAAELGDSLGYTINIKNATNVPQFAVVLRDTLPVGFKYIPGTARLVHGTTTVRTDAALGVVAGDRIINFAVGTLKVGESATITYRARIGVGSLRSDGVNRAQALSRNGASSNEARFGVRVNGGVFADEACVVGTVYRDCNDDGVRAPFKDDAQRTVQEAGVGGVRLYFENGAYVVTDPDGRFSLCGLSPTTHVLKIDPRTLPSGATPKSSSNRDAGDPESVFVDLKNGEMHHVDFALSCAAPAASQGVR